MNLRICICIFLCSLFACNEQKEIINVENLRCELLTHPQGIDLPHPRLSWEICSEGRGVRQTAYHILVASSPEKLAADEGDLWDSGKISSGESGLIPYGGQTLESRTVCYWKVRVSTNRGTSGWSLPAQWSVALLRDNDWQARWTGLDKSFPDEKVERKTRLAARYFRKEFQSGQTPAKATLYISGLGLYEAYINGSKIGNQVLSPTPTDYSKSVKYNTFDVTENIISGNNAIGVVLGNGRFFSMRIGDKDGIPDIRHFGFPKMLLQLELEYGNGIRRTVVSDDSWKVTADGPVRANNEFDGEEYDATREMQGWNTAGFDDAKWLQAEPVAAPEGKLEAQLNPNIKVMETLNPAGIKPLGKGVYVLDMGQNMVGWLCMKVKGRKGDQVKLRFAETVNPDGTIYLANIRGALVTDIYTLKGGDEETWEPSFVYHGFRFVEITGYPGTPTVDDFKGRVAYDEMEITGSFETSNATLNRIYKNAYWGIRGNYRGMPTDCPQRDERMGWLGDRAIGSQGESFLFDNRHLYAKWLDDIEQAQREDGSIPDVAPNYWRFYNDNMTWPGAYPIIANMLYEQYGDIEPLVKHYPSIRKWLTYMREKYMKDNLMPRDTYGDWCMPPESPELIHSNDPARKTDGALLGTSFYYRILTLMERAARLQNKKEDAEAFSAEAAAVKEAYNQRFFNPETAQYGNNTVTANLLSLCYGMTPEGFEEKVFDNIVRKTELEFNSHVSTGLVGIQWLMRGLSEHGRADLAFRIATNRDYPGWGYMIENGATTIWELWNGNTADPAMNSHNHVMLLGDLLVWFYENLAGIRNHPESAGFKKILMRPYPVDGLDYVTASYHSVHGEIKSAWKKAGDIFHWEISIPANTSAVVYIPATDRKQISESGEKISSAKGVKFIKTENNYAIYEVASGTYNFSTRYQ